MTHRNTKRINVAVFELHVETASVITLNSRVS